MSWRWVTTSFSRWDNSNTTSFLLLMSVYNFLALDGNPNQCFEITLCESVSLGQTYVDVNLEVFKLWEL